MRFLAFIIFLGLVGCSRTEPPLLVDCGNGYHVQPPLACPEQGLIK